MAGLTVDAGPLIALARGDRRVHAVLRRAADRNVDITVPATALAQAWRGPRNALLGRFLVGVRVEPMGEQNARRTGELLGATRTSDIADASIVISAARRGDDILTTDAADLVPLAAAAGGTSRIIELSQYQPQSR